MSFARKPKAFTLVELLVVIGIIAVLIGILLPALNRAREASKRTVCLSNMRELGTSMRIYASEFRDACPIGYMDEKAFTYIMNWCNGNSSPPKPSQMGLLVVSGISKNPKCFYCPSQIEDPQFTYQPNPSSTVYSQNPWPFATNSVTGHHTRLGYSARPIANWPQNYMPGGVTLPLQSDELFWLPSDGKRHLNIPRFSKMTGMAILADTNYCLTQVIKRHKTGINVLYANGSAKWVRLADFQKTPLTLSTPVTWLQMDENSAFNDSNNNVYLNDGTFPNYATPGTLKPRSQWTGLWVNLDKQG